jgi:hypothetical protein
LLSALPKLGGRRKVDIAEHGSHFYRLGMLLPHRVSQHLNHHGTKWFVFRFTYHIEQGDETQPCGVSTHCWQFKLGVAVWITQLEDNFVIIGNVRREVAVASVDTCGVKVSRNNPTYRTRLG